MLTHLFANQILNLLGGRLSSINYGTIEIGLSYTTPTLEGTGYTEPSPSTGYQRMLLGAYTQSLSQLLDPASNSEIKNGTKNIFFPKAIINYDSPITHFLIFSGNTLLAYGPLVTPVLPVANSVPLIEPNNLVIDFT